MNYLKHLIVACATGIGLFNLYMHGDGTTVTALFALYGTVLGVEVAKASQKE